MRRVLLSLLLVGCSAAPVSPSAPARSPQGGLEIEPVWGLGLFADEREKSQALIAEVVSSRVGAVLPYEVTQRAWALAGEGKNPLTGVSCGMALAPYQARKRWGKELGLTGVVSSNVWCSNDGGCELSVSGRSLDVESLDARFRWVSPVSTSGEALSALAAAVPALAPPIEKDGAGGLGLLGAMGSGKPLQEEDLLEVRIWHADHRVRTKVDDAQSGFPALTLAQVQTCLSGTDSSVTALTEVSREGAVTRCEGDRSDEPEAAACICGQLQRSAPADWLRGQRWTVTVGVDRRDQLTSDRRFLLVGSWRTYLQVKKVEGSKYPRFEAKVEDPSIEAWSPGPARLALGCFASAFSEPGALNSRWGVWFDGAGRPTKIVEQKGYPPLPKELAACVSRALRTAQAPCPSRPGLWAMAELRVSAKDPNAPPPSLKDALEKAP